MMIKTPWFDTILNHHLRGALTAEEEPMRTFTEDRNQFTLVLRGGYSEAAFPVEDEPDAMTMQHFHAPSGHRIPANMPTMTYVVLDKTVTVTFMRKR